MLILSLLLLNSCKDYGTEQQAPKLLLSKIDSVREATFRYQFNHNASGQQQAARVYFLSVMLLPDSTRGWKDADPADELLARFDQNIPPVKAYTKATVSMEGVFDRESGVRGLLFKLWAIRWIADDQAEVDGGYYEADLSASGNTYSLQRKNGIWVVTKDVMHFIS